MRGLNIIAALTVLICNIVVSYNHSIALFQSGGFKGWMAHIGVIAAEVTFVLGATNIVVSRLRGYSPGLPAMLGGGLGVLLVGWSNVAAGWEYGAVGIILGAVTPLSLIIAESILSRAALQWPTIEQPQSQEELTTSAVESLEEQAVEVDDDQPSQEPEEAEEPTAPPTPLQVAQRIYQDEGQLPGRIRLAKEAGCSDWEARKVLAELRGMAHG